MSKEPENAVNLKSNYKSLVFLDALRGIAAFIVMLGHARWLLWEGFSEFSTHPQDYNIFEKFLVYSTSFVRYGHQCVLLFFLLSGFVIHFKYSNSLKKDADTSFDLLNYLLRRSKRIYPPFLFAVILTFILDIIGTHLGYSIYYSGTTNELINKNVTNNHDIVNFIGNLFFLETNKIGIWGTNGPSWSLKFEWWFYLLYPVIFIFNKKSVFKGWLFVLILLIISSFLKYHQFVFFSSILKYLMIWWLGGLLADIYTKRIKVSHLILSALIIFIPIVILFSNKINDNFYADVFWSIGIFGLLNFFFYLQTNGKEHKWANKLKWLGDCSYTLYIIHFPILVFMNGIILHNSHNIMPRSMIFYFLAVFLLIAIAYLLHFIIEKPFIKKKN